MPIWMSNWQALCLSSKNLLPIVVHGIIPHESVKVISDGKINLSNGIKLRILRPGDYHGSLW